jgi:hypothetical protein
VKELFLRTNLWTLGQTKVLNLDELAGKFADPVPHRTVPPAAVVAYLKGETSFERSIEHVDRVISARG